MYRIFVDATDSNFEYCINFVFLSRKITIFQYALAIVRAGNHIVFVAIVTHFT